MEQKPLINRDYKYFESSSPKRAPNPLVKLSLNSKYVLLALGVVLGIVGVVIAQPTKEELPLVDNEKETSPHSKFVTSNVDINLVASADNKSVLPTPLGQQSHKPPILGTSNTLTPHKHTEPTSTPKIEETPEQWQKLKVKSGDTLAKVLSRAGLGPQQVHELVTTDKNTKKLTKIFPGDVFQILIDDQGTLQKLNYEIDETRKLKVTRKDGELASEIAKLPVQIQRKYAQGTIKSSLFLAAQKAGLPDKTTMELAGIFGWDIDFVLDIREGDSFAVLYEEIYRDGKKLRNGAIIAAEFTNRNKTYQAIRFETDDGFANYYAPDGSSMRKTFLRTPVEFSRISSKFSLGRRHPILNKIRSHKGVDYAAPTGTPIRATGDGKVTFRGTKGGYGKTVVIQHGSKYSTLYAHLSRYAKGSRSGKKVRQGQIIGYVGKTGLATGPHLHYEFRVNGVHRNPLTVKYPTAEPLEKRYMSGFNKIADSLLAQLETHKQTQIALSEQN